MRCPLRLRSLIWIGFIGTIVALFLLYSPEDLHNVHNRLGLNDPASETSKTSESKQAAIPTTSEVGNYRLVLFGDSWSAVGLQLAEQGRSWPEWVCSMWQCRLENFALRERTCQSPMCGSVVDEVELHTIATDAVRSLEQLPDLRSQVDQWLAMELDGTSNESGPVVRANDTIFVMSFVLWDIWKFHGLTSGDTKTSVSRSIDTIFQQLDRLAQYAGTTNLQILLMMSLDLTFLPAFDPSRNHKDMIEIVNDWNNKLKEKADAWNSKLIDVFDTNQFIKNQISSYQIFLAGLLDEHGSSRPTSWDDVENPCIQTQQRSWIPFQFEKQERCAHPEKYLFWDGLHLGPKANQMMAKEVLGSLDKLRAQYLQG